MNGARYQRHSWQLNAVYHESVCAKGCDKVCDGIQVKASLGAKLGSSKPAKARPKCSYTWDSFTACITVMLHQRS